MEEKIEELRNKIIHELDGLEDGVHISLDFEPRVIELIIISHRFLITLFFINNIL